MTDATNYYPADHPTAEPRDEESEMAENELEDDDIDLDDTVD